MGISKMRKLRFISPLKYLTESAGIRHSQTKNFSLLQGFLAQRETLYESKISSNAKLPGISRNYIR